MSPFHLNLESRDVIFTLGTSTRSIADFLTLLVEHEIRVGVDVRSFPTSRFPQFKKEFLKNSLASQGIQYFYLGKELGGFRKGGYVPYMETESFKKGLGTLEEIGKKGRTAFFCSERFPWKCHRRWISGQLSQKGWKVIHIIEEGKIWVPHGRDSSWEKAAD